jgi:hypothetical protein
MAAAGYLFFVCVPTRAGPLSASSTAPLDDERAERIFVAYAWPETDRSGLRTTFAADQDERLFETVTDSSSAAPYLGAARPPDCNALAHPAAGVRWTPWRGKRPRADLPGDVASR